MAADPTPEDPQRLLVLDGHSMAFRAFYALPAENFATDTGQHTNAVYGFTAMLLTMIRQQRPTHVAVAFDLSGPTFRSKEYGEYKAGRSETPAEFAGHPRARRSVGGRGDPCRDGLQRVEGAGESRGAGRGR